MKSLKIEHRVAVANAAVNVNDATYEGLYVFEPDALGPHCGAVKLILFTEKEPQKGAVQIEGGSGPTAALQFYWSFR